MSPWKIKSDTHVMCSNYVNIVSLKRPCWASLWRKCPADSRHGIWDRNVAKRTLHNEKHLTLVYFKQIRLPYCIAGCTRLDGRRTQHTMKVRRAAENHGATVGTLSRCYEHSYPCYSESLCNSESPWYSESLCSSEQYPGVCGRTEAVNVLPKRVQKSTQSTAVQGGGSEYISLKSSEIDEVFPQRLY